MIAGIIRWCAGNRLMVLLLTLFAIVGGVWASLNITVDAIPDLSDVQVIVVADYQGQAPEIVEQQVTYPLTTAMLAVPGAEVVRGYSMFGNSFVYVIFEDGTDLYWARSRVLEQLNFVAARLPEGVTPRLGPDATGVGWVYEYVLVTGPYCEEHPAGLWHDPAADTWHAARDEADEAARRRLVHHRVFPDRQACPLDGKPLTRPQVDLAELRSLQDWYLRYELTPLPGVSEVASVGGFVKQYQVVVDPVRLLAYDLPISAVEAAIRASNQDTGGSVMELAETEYMVRGRGYLGTAAEGERAGVTDRVLEDLRSIALGATEDGSPIYLRDVADVRVGPEMRRGVIDWNGLGETVGGIVVMRSGENARDTIDHVRAKLAELERGLPPGVAIRTGYDRSDLIDRAMHTLTQTLTEEVLVVSLVIVLFLLHARSALVAAFVLPTGVLVSVLIMHLMGLNANIMSLGGIAIAIGVMVDSSIIMVENAHKHLERARGDAPGGTLSPRDRARVVTDAAVEVGPSLFFSLLIITVSFLPVFVFGGEAGRMFRPLAFTKTFAMAAAAVLAITILPVLMVWFLRERVLPATMARWKQWALCGVAIALPAAVLALAPLPRLDDCRAWLVGGWVVLSAMVLLPQRIASEERNPISRLLEAAYNPAFALAMRLRWPALIAAAALMAATLWPLSQLGSEFMPPLEEGDLLYMPTTVEPGLSVTKAKELLQQTDKLIMQFPEVGSVMGKIGRAETATDPAPMNMIETVVTLHRDKARWRHVPVERFYSGWPNWLAAPLRRVLPDSRPITTDELVYGYEAAGRRVPGMNDVLQLPGLANSWTMPIRTRIDMLATGIRTPIGIKVLGPDLPTLSRLADEIALALRTDERTRDATISAFSEKTIGGSYLDITIDREAIARHAVSVRDVQDVIATALGGMNVTETVEGLERYPVNLRYPRELRDNVAALGQVLVPTPAGAHVPLAQLADIRTVNGPPMIKSENARLTAWVYVDIAGVDIGGYVEDAKRVVAEAVDLPAGYTLVWSGQFQNMQAARDRLMVVAPLTLAAIVLLLYLATRSWLRVCIVLLAVPFSLVGAFWLLWLLDYNLSLAVWVGIIALAGLDAETGLVMLLYLDNSFERFRAEGRMRNSDDLWWAVHDGAVKRIRPKTMTVVTTFVGLVPLMWATGAGADTMRRLAAPMIGGLATSFVLELLLYPVIFYLAKRIAMRRSFAAAEPPRSLAA